VAKCIRRLPRWAKWTIGVVAFLVIVTVVPRFYVKIRIWQEIRAIRAAGEPVTMEELLARYPEPKGENAAEVYQQAFAKYDFTKKGVEVPSYGEYVGNIRTPGRVWGNETKTKIADLLRVNAQALALLRRASVIPDCRFPLVRKEDVLTTLPDHFSLLQRGADLLRLTATLAAQTGDAPEAADSIATIFRMARSLGSEPWHNWAYPRSSLEETGVQTLEGALSNVPLSDHATAELGVALAEAEDVGRSSRFITAMRCEMSDLTVNHDLAGVFEAMQYQSPPMWYRAAYHVTGRIDNERLLQLQKYREAIAMCRLPLPERSRSNTWDRHDIGEFTSALYPIAEAFGWYRMVYFISDDVMRISHVRVARVALAVERYRLAEGVLPGLLDDLVPEYLAAIPQDPYDGKPMRYKLLEKGYVVYSVGSDGEDNGGRKSSADGRGGVDEVFTVAR
jgi:hypothetical protein